MNTPLQTSEWEKEFDERFGRAGFRANNVDWTVCAPEVKDFIRATRLKERETLISFIRGEVEGLVDSTIASLGEPKYMDGYTVGQHVVLTNLKERLKTLNTLSEQDTKGV